MGFPTVGVDVSWSTGPLDTPSWESIAGDVKAISTKSGRSAQFGGYEPGKATFRLNNRDRTYDPLHAAGPHFGDLKPNKRMRVRATWGGTTYDVGTFFADGWPQSYAPPSESESTVRAGDGFKLLQRKRMPDTYAAEVLADTPELWYRFNETDGTRINDSSGNALNARSSINLAAVAADGLIEHAGAVTLDQNLDMVIPKANFAGLGDLDPCTVEFWLRADKLPPTGGGKILSSASNNGTTFAGAMVFIYVISTGYLVVDFGTFATGGGGSYAANYATTAGTVAGSGTLVTDGAVHHVVVTRSGATVKTYIDGVDRTAQAGTSGTVVPGLDVLLDVEMNNIQIANIEKWDGDAELADLAIYSSAFSQADVLRHYQTGVALWDGDRTGERLDHILDAVGWPAADRNIDTGQMLLGRASWDKDTSALDLARLIEATEQGALYIDHRDAGKLRFRSWSAMLSATASTTSQATFTDEAADTTNVHYSGIEIDYDDTEIINSVTVNWVGGDVTVQDATSIDDGEQPITVDTLLRTRAEAEGLANWILAHTKDPRVRIRSITIKATGRNGAAEDATWEQVLGRRFGDRITVIRHPQGVGDPIETDVIIDGIDHEIANGVQTWTTTFRCSPAEAVDYWIVGTSAVGINTRPAL